MYKLNQLVSVVITCYNYGKYITTCIESVLSQTYQNFEIIIVNDGSTDKTDEIVEKFLLDPRIIYIKQENKGQARAKNVGINKTSGDFIAFLDADDNWCPGKLERQLACFANPLVGVVYSRANYIDESGSEFDYALSSKYLQPRRGDVTEWLVYDNFVPFSSSVVRRECFIKFGTFDENLKMGIDWDLWLRLSTGYEFDFVNDRLFNYRIGHSGQMSKNLEERQRCSDRIMERFLATYQGIISQNTIKRVYGYTCCNRGYYYRKIDRAKSNKYYLDAIKNNPFELCAYKGLLNNFIA